ncbi:MAG: hypothetical protein KBS95_04970 [Alistipes sp.]|nr:hypothetical protein [Candidatus Alistipes equi]
MTTYTMSEAYVCSSFSTYKIINDCVFFKYLVPRGEAYDKKDEEKLRTTSHIFDLTDKYT